MIVRLREEHRTVARALRDIEELLARHLLPALAGDGDGPHAR
ncbi:hypothetical protein ACFY8O_15085 [Streptomyces argenteolus]|uniref:FCD domain-containing protein n=1 Tax=Streptomyces argenteolus TaxID=67274 RepID=A0ABW6X872_9ACTN